MVRNVAHTGFRLSGATTVKELVTNVATGAPPPATWFDSFSARENSVDRAQQVCMCTSSFSLDDFIIVLCSSAELRRKRKRDNRMPKLQPISPIHYRLAFTKC